MKYILTILAFCLSASCFAQLSTRQKTEVSTMISMATKPIITVNGTQTTDIKALLAKPDNTLMLQKQIDSLKLKNAGQDSLANRLIALLNECFRQFAIRDSGQAVYKAGIRAELDKMKAAPGSDIDPEIWITVNELSMKVDTAIAKADAAVRVKSDLKAYPGETQLIKNADGSFSVRLDPAPLREIEDIKARLLKAKIL